mmetsp:Transcript_13584/g.25902  ORF Transcript_13584/g.25902 Transcript_13584/m.25902 type:complete len:208 (-) Transcript_13584:62-685(-)
MLSGWMISAAAFLLLRRRIRRGRRGSGRGRGCASSARSALAFLGMSSPSSSCCYSRFGLVYRAVPCRAVRRAPHLVLDDSVARLLEARLVEDEEVLHVDDELDDLLHRFGVVELSQDDVHSVVVAQPPHVFVSHKLDQGLQDGLLDRRVFHERRVIKVVFLLASFAANPLTFPLVEVLVLRNHLSRHALGILLAVSLRHHHREEKLF